jgi:hypothetical protein
MLYVVWLKLKYLALKDSVQTSGANIQRLLCTASNSRSPTAWADSRTTTTLLLQPWTDFLRHRFDSQIHAASREIL